jgi:hypothetical protein
MKKNEIGGECTAHGKFERRKQGFGENPEGRDHLED